MKCWNCQNSLDLPLLCERCGMPQPVASLSPFEILGLPPRLHWGEGEIRAVYEKLARRCHPDLFRAHRDDRVITAAGSAMRALNDAYRTLREPQRRLNYVLSATRFTQDSTRTVPPGLEDSVQIIERVLSAVEEASRRGDRAGWEAQQDHLAALEVKVEKARERSDATLRQLVTEWDAAVLTADGEWPEDLPDEWTQQVRTWVGERGYLDAVRARMEEGRRKPEESAAPAAR
jgi:DnaJ-domain-containing protein 1